VIEQVDIETLVERLTECLADLDRIGAYIPAAHVDAALNALQRRFDIVSYPSELD
jgi:hypothetical protein